jgi:hypothetical protein
MFITLNARRLAVHFVQPTASLLTRVSAENNAALWKNDVELEQHVEGMGTTGGGWAIWATCQIASGCVQAGRIDQALRVIDLGCRLQDESGARWFASDLCHLRACCALLQSRLDCALADLLAAVEIAQCQGANYFLLKALTTLLKAFPDGGPLPGARVAMEQTLAPMRAWANDPHVRAAPEIETR